MPKSLYSGQIQMLVEDLCVEDIVCLRLKCTSGVYPTVTYREVFYTQLHGQQIGQTILWVEQIQPAVLKTLALQPVYQQYCQEAHDAGGLRLSAAIDRYRKRLLLHHMSDGRLRLIVAGDIEIYDKQPPEFRYWENGYHYRDAYLYYTVPPAD